MVSGKTKTAVVEGQLRYHPFLMTEETFPRRLEDEEDEVATSDAQIMH